MTIENTIAAGSKANSGIVHITPHKDGAERAAPSLLTEKNDDDIKEVDMSKN